MTDAPLNPPRPPLGIALLLCLLNWLIPGAGFLAAKDYRRGIALFLLLNGTFFAGLLYSGTMNVPVFRYSDPSFNIVAVLTFVVQICHLGGSLLLLGLQDASGVLAQLFVRDAGAPFSDLGAFHFLVAGALNYFATMRLWDVLTGTGGAVDNPTPQTEAQP